MKKFMEELYRQAKCLAGDTLYQTEEYQQLAVEQMKLFLKMRNLFGDDFGELMEKFTESMGRVWDMECGFFFEQGYFEGQRGLFRRGDP